jgi:putative ABC transport system permease protein
MITKTALRMMAHEPARFGGTAFGVGLALFLVVIQCGFYFGFKRDISVVQDSFDADVWITPRSLLTFDFAARIDDVAYWKARGVPGVEEAARVVFEFGQWRLPGSGAYENLQVLGVEFVPNIRFDFGAPFDDPATLLRPEGHVLVDQKEAPMLGVSRRGQEVEINGRRVRVVGFVRGKKLFTAARLVVTDLDNARRLQAMAPQRVSYIAIRCRKGADIGEVAQRLRLAMPEHDVLTARTLHDLTQDYWESRTGIGPILYLSASMTTLGGFLTVLMTFYILTVQKLPVFAALKALGASGADIGALLAVQAGVIYAVGAVIGCVALIFALAALERTLITVVVTTGTAAVAAGVIALATALACVPSLWKIMRLEPAEAFRA